jgi:hypothetical protein
VQLLIIKNKVMVEKIKQNYLYVIYALAMAALAIIAVIANN